MDVMSACAQIVKKHAGDTLAQREVIAALDTLQLQYFSNSLIDAQVAALLRPYLASRLG